MPDDMTIFGNAPVDEPEGAYLSRQAERIRGLGRVAAHSIIEMGRTLIEVKERVGHGRFLPWVEREFAWSETQTQRFMQVARSFGTKSPILGDLPAGGGVDVSALYALAMPVAAA